MAQNNERNPHTVLIPLGALAGAASDEIMGIKIFRDVEILSASVIDSAGVSASNSNYLTLGLKNHTTSDVIATLDSRAANQGALTAKEGLDMLLSATYAPKVARGSTLTVTRASTGTAAMTGAVLCLVLHYF